MAGKMLPSYLLSKWEKVSLTQLWVNMQPCSVMLSNPYPLIKQTPEFKNWTITISKESKEIQRVKYTQANTRIGLFTLIKQSKMYKQKISLKITKSKAIKCPKKLTKEFLLTCYKKMLRTATLFIKIQQQTMKAISLKRFLIWTQTKLRINFTILIEPLKTTGQPVEILEIRDKIHKHFSIKEIKSLGSAIANSQWTQKVFEIKTRHLSGQTRVKTLLLKILAIVIEILQFL